MLLSMLRRRYGGAVSIIPSNNKFLPPGRSVSTCMLSKVLSNTNNNNNTNTIPYDDDSGSRVILPDYLCFNKYISAVTWFENNLSDGYASISEYNAVLSSLLRMGYHPTVLSFAQQLEESHNNHLQRVLPDIHTWTILIKAHAFDGNMFSAMSFFHKIINNGHRPTAEETLNILLHGFCVRHQIHKAMLFYNYIVLKNENGAGFKWNYHSYLILITGLCRIGETQSAIQLLRKALQIEIDTESLHAFTVMRCYNTIIFRLACKDRLINQAYDLYSEMKLHGNNVSPNSHTYHHLIFGYCIIGQFKQAIRLFKEFKASINIRPCLLTIAVTEREVKSAKSVVAVMIKGGLRPNVASYHSVIDRLYKGQSRRRVMNKIAQKVDTLVRPKIFPDGYYDYM
ncbi:pentatricopeptide (PPR) repeat protein [Medicago truncatula]|uniref:Pentatricopeptide (PPR) repeat protein n=3 Tax=Medicago truncatula TaxID=3880 RepID=A0A072VK89_MEDTR|nr:pentatricopeptide (PPR) repeat protein [Medicago truncatula]